MFSFAEERNLAACRIHLRVCIWQNRGMTSYVPFDRSQPFLLPPDLKDWLPEDDVAHFVVAAADRVR